MPETKFCKKCSTIKPVSEFRAVKKTYKEKTYTYLHGSCIQCVNDELREWRDAHTDPEKLLAIQKRREARNRVLEEWHPMKSPVPFHTLRGNSKTKYNRTDRELTKSPIFTCNCGNRYLKTRKGQVDCHRCMANSMVY